MKISTLNEKNTDKLQDRTRGSLTGSAVGDTLDCTKNMLEEQSLRSESGIFHIDDCGIVHRFEPLEDNPFIDEKTEFRKNHSTITHKSVRTFIVPQGVKGFVSAFMRYTRVLERFELPDRLLSLGNNSFDINTECNCVFADCILPTVVIPESVKEIGIFAFGGSHIDCLQLPATLNSPYGRQFKDSYIATVRLPKEWEHGVSLGEDGKLEFSGCLCDNEQYGYLRWPSTQVGSLEFFEK